MDDAYEGWAIVEQMGHVRLIGKIREVTQFGATMARVEVLQPDGTFKIKDVGGGSIYAITPITEDTARNLMKPMEITPWQLPRTASGTPPESDGIPY
jgi:hypothetical protein